MFNSVAQLQEEIAARLAADGYFVDITVITERQGDISNRIDQALAGLVAKGGKVGLAILVGVLEADVDAADVPGPNFNDTAQDVTIFERPVINDSAAGTGKAAVDVAVRVCQICHHYQAQGIGQTIYCDKNAIRPIGEVRPGVIAYKVRLRAPVDTEVLAKVLPPVITPTSGAVPQSVTITCPTSGAAIYYTTDLSYPWSGNANATLYSGAFNITTACMLRAVAHKSGSVASDARSAEFT